ncbi:YaaA family protein [Helicobacter anatolicus]|uniref:YaaA family protein n=1 Tax=Helicobacter anatolicus TaxID=2905874 RepID=UPI001E2B1217|nr:peroxide stress protein YaaA [Helicobacter anatolicus]MCE3039777.1 YaaA family protein [Helicobacter anatolicus]
MKILLSPSEGKNKNLKFMEQENNFLESLTPKFAERKDVVISYLEALDGEDKEICKIFGTKSVGMGDLALSKNMFYLESMQAIQIYDGVAFKALDFASLNQKSKDFIFNHVCIFSNLLGMIEAKDKIPYYKLNQNYKNKNFGLNTIYKKMTKVLDEYFSDKKIIDLRAEVYIKAYPIKKEHIVVEFLKNGKKVSHYAKHYRGVFLRDLALHQGDITALKTLHEMELKDIVQEKNKNIYIYDVINN